MHGRGSRGTAPTSDVVRRGDAGGTPLTARRCRVGPRLPRGFFFFFFAESCRCGWDSARFALMRLRLDPICVVSVEIGEMAGSSRNGRFRLKFKHSLSLRHSSLFSVLFAVCVCSASLNHSLPLCLCSPSRHLHSNPTQMLLSYLVFRAGFSKKKKNTNSTLLARDKELHYKNLWLPQNTLCFVFYWTPRCTQSHVAVLVILP